MEQDKFDDIAKAMAGSADRRSILKRIAGTVLGGAFAALGASRVEATKKCGKDGSKCHGTGQCCKGYYCAKNGGSYGKCRKTKPTPPPPPPPPPPTCKKYGEKCSSTYPCCAGKNLYCDTSKGYGKCKYRNVSPPPPPPPPACKKYGESCKTGYCCTDKNLYCDPHKKVCKYRNVSPPPPPPAVCPKNGSDACSATPTCGNNCSCAKDVYGHTVCRKTLGDCGDPARKYCNHSSECGYGKVCVNVDNCCPKKGYRGLCSTKCYA